MSKKIFLLSVIIAASWWCGVAVKAQKRYQISAKDAVAMAVKNTIELKNLRLDSARQKAKNREITGLTLPQISGTAQVAHYLTLPYVLFPKIGRAHV